MKVLFSALVLTMGLSFNAFGAEVSGTACAKGFNASEKSFSRNVGSANVEKNKAGSKAARVPVKVID